MKEADIMINGLMIANEIMKLEIERLKKEKGSLISEVQSLQSSNDLKNQRYENLERQVASDLTEIRSMVLEMEGIVAEDHTVKILYEWPNTLTLSFVYYIQTLQGWYTWKANKSK